MKKNIVNISDVKAKAKEEEINRLLAITRMVLESNTVFSKVLTKYILVWGEGVELEREVMSLRLEQGIVQVARLVRKT